MSYIEEEPAQPVEKQYRVTGEAAVFGHSQGEVFSTTLSFEQEAMFVEYGHLEVVNEPEPVESETKRSHHKKQPEVTEESSEQE